MKIREKTRKTEFDQIAKIHKKRSVQLRTNPLLSLKITLDFFKFPNCINITS